MRRKERSTELSIAFLDVITCGFGAIILLLMIAKVGDAAVVEEAPEQLDGRVEDLQEQLFEIRGEAKVLNRDLTAKREQLSTIKERVALLESKLSSLQKKEKAEVRDSSVSEKVRDELAAARQSLTEEMQRLLANRNKPRTDMVGGVPVDSEYIVFIIDTSGSMFRYAWPKMMKTMVEILDIYPQVKGIQVMNDMGQYMFPTYRGSWIPDTPARRRAVLQRLSTWNAFSNSSPVEGITAAIRTFYSPDKKISLYVLGDEFTGPSIRQVVNVVDTINHRTRGGEPRVRIHGVGFPVQFDQPNHNPITGVRFASLMRELTRRNGGTFVALNDYRR